MAEEQSKTGGGKKATKEVLYISLEDPVEKRKNILSSLKNSLIMQEEAEKIKSVRENKIVLLNNIKNNIAEILKKYDELRKKLPNVKGTLSLTEKEITELESHIKNMKDSIKYEREHIKEEQELKKKVKRGELHEVYEKLKEREEKEKGSNKKSNKKKEPNKEFMDSSQEKKLSKRERIKNNLEVIEDRLNNL